MDEEFKEKIEVTVRQLLHDSDMDEATEYQIRKAASEKLDFDLSKGEYRVFVRQVVNSYLEEENAKSEQGQEQLEEEKVIAAPTEEYDDDGDLIVCRLSEKRKVTIQDFKGKPLVSIREFYQKDGKELPSNKGMSLTEEQWMNFNKNICAIDDAIEQMKLRLM